MEDVPLLTSSPRSPEPVGPSMHFVRGSRTPPPASAGVPLKRLGASRAGQEDDDDDDPMLRTDLGFSRGTATPPPISAPGGAGPVSFDSDFPMPTTDASITNPYGLAPLRPAVPAMPPPVAASSAAATYGRQPPDQAVPARTTATLPPTQGVAPRRPLTFAGGTLPDDFLRLTIPVTVEQPVNAAYPLGHNGVLFVNIQQARLTKSYGLVKMDPYVRVQIGYSEGATEVCQNGGKEPRFRQRIQLHVTPESGSQLRIEVLDMGTFSDRLVGWTTVDVASALNGEPLEDWFPLSGKQGEDKEGVIHIHITFQPLSGFMQPGYYPMVPNISSAYVAAPPAGFGGYRQYPQPAYVQQPMPMRDPMDAVMRLPVESARPPDPSPEAVKQIHDMFPEVDAEVIQSVLAANHNNVEQTINALLSMGPT